MKYVVYLKMPEYTKEYVLHRFSEDGKVAKCIHLSAMEGFLQEHLKLRQNFYPKEEIGNLPLEIPNLMTKKNVSYNYLPMKERLKLASMFKSIMFCNFWNFMIPHLRALKTDRNRKVKANTMIDYIIEFFDNNGISTTPESILRFKVEINREKKRLKEKYGIEI